jgi:hypothetical protein
MLTHPTSCAALTAYLYPSREAAVGALVREVERQRRKGWRAVRVEVTPSACTLCGEPYEVRLGPSEGEPVLEEHECPRDAPTGAGGGK